MVNFSGIVAVLNYVTTPRWLIPTLRVHDIRCIDWKKLKREGYNGVVIDKDNCITKPYHDDLVPELHHAWQTCLSTFGVSRVLIVSNSAGTHEDPALIQAESVSRHLGVPVLVHASKKPSYRVVRAIESFFMPVSKNRPHVSVIYPPNQRDDNNGVQNQNDGDASRVLKLIVIGDRVTTDIILASRLRARLESKTSSLSCPKVNPVVSVLTEKIWQKERLGTRLMRRAENRALDSITRPISIQFQQHKNPTQDCLINKLNQSWFSSIQRLPNVDRSRESFSNKYNLMIKASQNSPSTILQDLSGNLTNWACIHMHQISTHFKLILNRFKSSWNQYLKQTFNQCKLYSVTVLKKSILKILSKIHSFDPTLIGFKTPLSIQHLSKWRQLK